MSLILDALRKARESREPASPDPYLIVGGKRFSRQRVFTNRSMLVALLGSSIVLGIVAWFLLSPKVSQDRPTPTALGETTKQVQAAPSQALDTRPTERAQSAQTQSGKTQGVSPPAPQSPIEATAPLEPKPPQALTTAQPKAVEAPSERTPTSTPIPEKTAVLPPRLKEKEVDIPKTDKTRTTVRKDYEAVKIPSKEITISALQGGKQAEQERFHLQLAISSHKSKQFQKALEEYQKVLKLNPSNSQARNNLGLIYKDMGNLDQAATEYMQLIALEPNNVKAYNNLGTIYYLQGRFREAVEEFTKALAIDQSNVESSVNLALAYKRQGQKRKAVEVFQHVLSIDSQLAEAHYNLALLVEEMGDVSTALLHFQKFVDLSQDKHVNLVEEVRRHIEELSSNRQIRLK